MVKPTGPAPFWMMPAKVAVVPDGSESVSVEAVATLSGHHAAAAQGPDAQRIAAEVQDPAAADRRRRGSPQGKGIARRSVPLLIVVGPV